MYERSYEYVGTVERPSQSTNTTGPVSMSADAERAFDDAQTVLRNWVGVATHNVGMAQVLALMQAELSAYLSTEVSVPAPSKSTR